MPYVAVPDHLAGDVFTLANWQTHIEGNLNAGVERPLYDSGSLAVAAASVDITSIPATFANLMVAVYGRGDTAAATTGIALRLNNDTAASYDYQYLSGGAGTASAGELFAATSAALGSMPANTAGANLFGASWFLIPHYAGSISNKLILALNGYKSGTASGNQGAAFFQAQWRSNAAINRVTLLPGAGNFAAGSRVVLYGLGGMV